MVDDLEPAMAPSPAPLQPHPDSPGDAGPSPPAGALVYVVDPDGAEAAIIGTLVRRIGATPRLVAGVAELVAARPGPGSCVVAEMRLPGGDGLDLLAALKAGGIAVPVIFVTGDRDVGRAVIALRAGATDYLVKPWVEQRLAARIRRALGMPDPDGEG